MTGGLRRSAAFAAVATISLATPFIGALVAVPFALIAVVGRTLSAGRAFELFATPEDRIEGELRGLVGFSLAATALALLAALSGLPDGVFVLVVLLSGYGSLGERLACLGNDTAIRRALGFAVGGALAAFGGGWAVAAYGPSPVEATTTAFLAVSGALLAALLRAALGGREDPVVVVSTALGLWVLSSLRVPVGPLELAVAVAVAGGFGLLSWVLGTASITGMLTGVIIGTWTIALAGYGWFVVLLAFFGIGGLASKYRYEEKRSVGVAEDNEGARSGRNVLGNGAVALLAVVGFAAGDALPVAPGLFAFAFAGAVATAMSDTLSSEVGVLYGPPRLLTTLEPVETGTDGGVTPEGSLAGLAGAAVIAAGSYLLLGIGPVGAAAVVVAGVAGMLADSLLGATVEGRRIGNQAVNFLATLAGALLASAVALAGGLI